MPIDEGVRRVKTKPMGNEAAHRREALNEVLGRVARRDREALRDVYDQTSSRVFGTIIRIVRDRERAEDLVQDVYLLVWERAGRFDPAKGSAITWLCTIARNTSLNELRKSGRDRDLTENPFPDVGLKDVTPADDWLCDMEDCEALARCLEELQDDQRSSIMMAFFDGFTHSELAAQLKTPIGTVKSWIRRGLADLRGCLGG